MSYQSVLYLGVFLPLLLIIYQLTHQKYRRYVLLIFSFLYFFSFSRWLILYLFAAIVTGYVGGILIENAKEQKRGRAQRRAVRAAVILLLAMLAYTKYTNFFLQLVSALAGLFRYSLSFEKMDILAPIGISYYTLEAVGYLLDVFWGTRKAERSLVNFALFLSFFPQTMEGPIARYQQTGEALPAGKGIDLDHLVNGSMRILYGLFKKMVIADRLAKPVNMIFSGYASYSGGIVLYASVLYMIQLYCEFSGIMDVVLGSAQLFGITLPENFRQPFFAVNAADFWRRWHISLGVWLKNYIFYPVTVSSPVKKWNRYARKKWGKFPAKLGVTALSLLPVWLLCGLWHGGQWNYIFYGIYYFVVLFLEVALEPAVNAFMRVCHIRQDAKWWHALRVLKTWIIIFSGELFFRATDLNAGLHMFLSIFHDFNLRFIVDGSIGKLGMSGADHVAVIAGMLVVLAIDILKERGLDPRAELAKKKLPLQWAVSYALIFSIVIFGAYGAGYQAVDLIYAGF